MATKQLKTMTKRLDEIFNTLKYLEESSVKAFAAQNLSWYIAASRHTMNVADPKMATLEGIEEILHQMFSTVSATVSDYFQQNYHKDGPNRKTVNPDEFMVIQLTGSHVRLRVEWGMDGNVWGTQAELLFMPSSPFVACGTVE